MKRQKYVTVLHYKLKHPNGTEVNGILHVRRILTMKTAIAELKRRFPTYLEYEVTRLECNHMVYELSDEDFYKYATAKISNN